MTAEPTIPEAAPFDHMAPLPVMPDHRHTRSWEPAARHYRDLSDDEKESIG